MTLYWWWVVVRWSMLVLGLIGVGAILVWSLRLFGWQEVFAYAATALAGVVLASLLTAALVRRFEQPS